ncbi:MAG TPA: ABC transporter ATP-binding protein [Candidatus Avimonas sp.]|nr:ABC transporter ATP-binding protein [Candidatus Avimonas sp.]
MSEIIKIEELYKIYRQGNNEVRALNGISLKVEKGEFVAIVGHSGSGKTTLMNVLGCLDTPTSGIYTLEGKNVSSLSDYQLSIIRNRHIGFIFQGFNLIPNLDALENVELPLIYRGMRREQRRKIALESLERVGLGNRIHHRPAEMSGGQQQRVAIARAIAARPPIILADEPTGNLDTTSGKEILKILLELNAEGKTVILITHDLGIASHANRIVEIRDGQIISDRPARPAVS